MNRHERGLEFKVGIFVFAGLAMLVKYVMLWPLAGMLMVLVLDRKTHHWRTLVGLALAVGVLGLALLPHVLWLKSTDFLPFRYARSVAQAMPGPMATGSPSDGDWLA